MSEGKIDFALGALSFSGQGDQDWVATQLDKVLEAAAELQKVQPLANLSANPGAASTKSEAGFTDTLARYNKPKGG